MGAGGDRRAPPKLVVSCLKARCALASQTLSWGCGIGLESALVITWAAKDKAAGGLPVRLGHLRGRLRRRPVGVNCSMRVGLGDWQHPKHPKHPSTALLLYSDQEESGDHVRQEWPRYAYHPANRVCNGRVLSGAVGC